MDHRVTDKYLASGSTGTVRVPQLHRSPCTITFKAVGSIKVKVTLRLTVSQSVCLGVEPNLGLLTTEFFSPPKVTVLSFGAPSLTRGRVYHMSVFVIEVYSSQSLFTTNIYI
jgi:hypothetical protein